MGESGPDLYVTDTKTGGMQTLFEIKASRDSQSTFTAIGQLIVYSEQGKPAPKRVLVTQGLPKSNHFEPALKRHNIGILYYEVKYFKSQTKVTFNDLEEVLAATS